MIPLCFYKKKREKREEKKKIHWSSTIMSPYTHVTPPEIS